MPAASPASGAMMSSSSMVGMTSRTSGAGSSANVYGPRLTNSSRKFIAKQLHGFRTDAVEFRVRDFRMILAPVLYEADRGWFEDDAPVLQEAGVGSAIDTADAARGDAHQAIVGHFFWRAIRGAAGDEAQDENECRCKPPHAAIAYPGGSITWKGPAPRAPPPRRDFRRPASRISAPGACSRCAG